MSEPRYIELTDFSDPLPSNTKDHFGGKLTRQQIQLILLRLGVISDEDYRRDIGDDPIVSKSVEYIIWKIIDLSVFDAVSILREVLVEHHGDVNFPRSDYEFIERLVSLTPDNFDVNNANDNDNYNYEEKSEPKSRKHKAYLDVIDWNLQVRLEAALISFHSPYPEIRAITDPYDDSSISAETFRVYAIGLFWTIIGSIVNKFFVHRLPAVSLSSHTVQILLMPSGKLWERYMPNRSVSFLGYTVDLNPGPWTYKEMMLATIMYLCSSGLPYLIYNIFVMKLEKFYGLKWVSWLYQFLLVVSTEFLGFGFSILMKKVCVYPSKSLWPTILPIIAINRALMNEEPNNTINGWRISRYKFFFLVLVCSFFYNWIPSYFFNALSNFNWPTWFDPKLVHLTNVSGSNEGLGFNPWPSFDWNIIGSAGCLTIPFYTYANQYFGSLLAFFVILAVYYTNNKWTGYFPINSNQLYNNEGKVYNVRDILNDSHGFDKAKYEHVGPPYFSAANLVIYGAYFCLYPFAILYHLVTEWESMKSSFINVFQTLQDAFSRNQKFSVFGRYSKDPHCQMMAKYDEVPDWWFLSILLTSTSFAIICVVFYPSETPVWGIFFTIFINFMFLIPITAIASVTGFSFGLNVLVELIVGYAIPNSGLALITLKSFGYNIDSQASNYITDQKLGHYTKLPPRAVFRVQIISTFVSVVIALCIANWQLANVPNLCEPHQRNKLSCPGANTYFYSSIQYGEIGPAKVFSGLYPALKWCFLLGVVLVLPCVWFKRIGPKRITAYFHPTIILGGFLNYAPFNLLYFTVGLYFSFTFMHYIKNNYMAWWEKYNYILTSALSAGVAFSTLLMFFTVALDDKQLDWWGNRVSYQGVENGEGRTTWLDVSSAPDGYIGIRKGHFP
ncbi:uncharacterized protein PRCAT00006265001 [Priceomyces carsonii]|uniref:uncharacterized protein n=1 Tax=Priceomyces carsonii TaxID=28549 RepID=UPI002ED795AF|nr:unnamed protein product [Priceomyces carsonii]